MVELKDYYCKNCNAFRTEYDISKFVDDSDSSHIKFEMRCKYCDTELYKTNELILKVLNNIAE